MTSKIVQNGPKVLREIGPDHFWPPKRLTKRLGIEVIEEGVNTVAGYIQRNNERLPRAGDTARLSGYLLTVLVAEDDGIWIDVVQGEWKEELP